MRCADKGFDLVCITVQGRREANATAKIREGLFKNALEKICMNPGNFADGRKYFEEKIYETEEACVFATTILVGGDASFDRKMQGLEPLQTIPVEKGESSW